MRIPLILLTILIFAAGCGTRTVVVKTQPEESPSRVTKRGHEVAADNHLKQGIQLYHLGKYKQSQKHLIRAITNDRKAWEAHYYLGLVQQKMEHYDRSIGAFNNALKYCPQDKPILARINFSLGVSWEKEGYLYKARNKYTLALRFDPTYVAAQAGIDRVKTKTAKAEAKKKSKKDDAF